MKDNWKHLDKFRAITGGFRTPPGATCGAFRIAWNNDGVFLNVIASDGFDGIKDWGWEHVSCHTDTPDGKQTPTWEQMDYLKDLFWNPEETVLQYHVPKSKHINIHAHVLHLWRNKSDFIILPPKELV